MLCLSKQEGEKKKTFMVLGAQMEISHVQKSWIWMHDPQLLIISHKMVI